MNDETITIMQWLESEGCNDAEIGEYLGTTAMTVRDTLERAKATP